MKRVEVRLGGGDRCGQVWEAFTPEFNKMRPDQPMAYPDYGSIRNHEAR
jgi:hypothetical protein